VLISKHFAVELPFGAIALACVVDVSLFRIKADVLDARDRFKDLTRTASQIKNALSNS
jgi:hypothetical protein